FVHHRFGNFWITSPLLQGIPLLDKPLLSVAFRSSSHHASHIGLVLVGSLGSILSADHSCRSDRGRLSHEYAVACNGDKCPGRGGIVVDKDIDGKLAIQNGGSHRVGLHYRTAVGI